MKDVAAVIWVVIGLVVILFGAGTCWVKTDEARATKEAWKTQCIARGGDPDLGTWIWDRGTCYVPRPTIAP